MRRLIFIRESILQYLRNCWELAPIEGVFLALLTPLVFVVAVVYSFFTTDLGKIVRN